MSMLSFIKKKFKHHKTCVKILFVYGIPCVNLVGIHGHEGHTKESGH
jgi:hypothetical protein